MKEFVNIRKFNNVVQKEETFRNYTIKIDRVRGIKKVGVGSFEYTDKMFLVDIGSIGGRHTLFSVEIGKNYGASLKRLMLEIRKEL